MKRTFHMALDVRGAIRNGEWRRSLVGACAKDGEKLSADEILNELLDSVAAGHKLLPLCSPDECPDFSFQTGCPGHEVQEDLRAIDKGADVSAAEP